MPLTIGGGFHRVLVLERFIHNPKPIRFIELILLRNSISSTVLFKDEACFFLNVLG